MKPLALSFALLASLLFAVPSKADTVPVDDFVLDEFGLKLFWSLPESPTPDEFVEGVSFAFHDLPVHPFTSDGPVTNFSAFFFSGSSGSGIIMGCFVPNPALPPNFCDAIGTPGIGLPDQLFFFSTANGPTFIPGTYIDLQDGPDFKRTLTITRETPEMSALTLLACGLAFLLCYQSLARRSV
jgi:hypothetical protein